MGNLANIYRTIICFALSGFILSCACSAQESIFIKVHYLHGSKPRRAYKDVEKPYFGGMQGGHFGIELADGQIAHFRRLGECHVFPRHSCKHSGFFVGSKDAFYRVFDGVPDSMEKTMFVIPVKSEDYAVFLDKVKEYQYNLPFDYAFFGMRCSAAAWHLLGYTQVVAKRPPRLAWFLVFRPKKMYRKLERLSAKHNWEIERYRGTPKRKWNLQRCE